MKQILSMLLNVLLCYSVLSCDSNNNSENLRIHPTNFEISSKSDSIVINTNIDNWHLGRTFAIVGKDTVSYDSQKSRQDTIASDWFSIYTPKNQIIVIINENDQIFDRKITIDVVSFPYGEYIYIMQSKKQ